MRGCFSFGIKIKRHRRSYVEPGIETSEIRNDGGHGSTQTQ
jgi:hypothetical protein